MALGSPVSSLIRHPISLRNVRVREPTAPSDSNATDVKQWVGGRC